MTIEGVKEQLEEFNFNPQSIITFDLFIDVSLFYWLCEGSLVSFLSQEKNLSFYTAGKMSDSCDLSVD